MKMKKFMVLLTLLLALLFTAGLAMSVMAEETTTNTNPKITNPVPVTPTTTTTVTPSVTPVAPTDAKNKNTKWQNVKKQILQVKQADKKLQVQQKQLQKLMPTKQFSQLLDQEVNKPRTAQQKINVGRALQGIIKKIETTENGKIKLSVQRADKIKAINTYFTANLDPAKILVYDRTTKTQKTLAEVKVGDVVRIIPVRGASLFVVDIISHQTVVTPPVTPTTPDTITLSTTDTL